MLTHHGGRKINIYTYRIQKEANEHFSQKLQPPCSRTKLPGLYLLSEPVRSKQTSCASNSWYSSAAGKKKKTTPILTSQALYSRSRLSVSVKKCVCARVDYVIEPRFQFSCYLFFCLDITIYRHNNTKARSSLERSCDIVHVANTSVCRSGLGSSTLYFTTTYSRPYTLHLNFLCVISSWSVLR